jgi:hypothetical protein
LRSIVFIVRSMTMPGSSPSARNSVGPSGRCGFEASRAMMIQVFAPFAPVISHLRPLMVKFSPSKVAAVDSWAGSEPAPSGSVMAKTERWWPATTGARKRWTWSGSATLDSRNMLPSSGAAQFIATGPSVDQPAAS